MFKNRDEHANRYVNLNIENDTHLRSFLTFSYQPNVLHWMLRELDFKDFRLLRVLNLEGLVLEEKLIRAVGNLIHLKYLSLKEPWLFCFPSSIGNLGCMRHWIYSFTLP